MCAEGKVAQRAEIQPIANKAYLDLKKLYPEVFLSNRHGFNLQETDRGSWQAKISSTATKGDASIHIQARV